MHALSVREYYSEHEAEGEETSSPPYPPALFSALIGTDSKSPALSFTRVWRELTLFIMSHTPSGYTPLLIAHNAPFDTSFIAAELERSSIVFPSSWRFACSLQMARDTFGEGQSCKQAILAKRFGVDVRNEHHAEDDTRVLSDILHAVEKHIALHSKSGDSMLEVLAKNACGLHDMAVQYDNYAVIDDENFDTISGMSSYGDNSGRRKPVFVTRTGRLWHRNKDCFALRRATKISQVDEPDPELSPCARCASDELGDPELVKKAVDSDRKKQMHSVPSEPNNVNNCSDLFVTKTGKLFHANENCSSLRLAHQVLRVPSPRPGLFPCSKCVGKSDMEAVPLANLDHPKKPLMGTVKRSDEHKTGEEFVQVAEPSHDIHSQPVVCERVVRLPLTDEHRSASEKFSIARYGPFVRTATGKKFHRKDCAAVRGRNTFHHDHNAEDLEPCRRCLANVYLMWHHL